MTTPGQEPPTEVDPGREPRIPAGSDAPVTELDPGRSRRDGEPATELDPGRSRPVAGWTLMLPPGLAARFEIVNDLTTGSGQQADVYLVRDRTSGDSRVLKVYRRGWRLDERVLDYLPRRKSRHIVRVYEAGEEEDRQYEIMEYLAGGNLFQKYVGIQTGLGEEPLTEVVRQLAEGLTELHEAGIVHRDLKPGNVLIRGLESLDVVIADVGISRWLDDVEAFTQNRDVGTLPYTPPEYISGGQIRPAFDWWSLGITVVELATGRPMFYRVDKQALRAHIGTRPITVDAVRGARLQLLCRGLLTRDPGDRWGTSQVSEWLAGGSPPVAAESPAYPGTPEEAGTPFLYLGTEYRDRYLLAGAMTTTWETARRILYSDDVAPRQRLTEWLRQFPDYQPPEPRRMRRASVDVLFLHQLRAIAPAYPPFYRGWNITERRLPDLAQDAIQNPGSRDIVNDLWSEDLLPLLATGSAVEEAGGGDRLDLVRYRWREEDDRLREAADSVPDEDARAELRRRLRRDQAYQHVLALLAATATDEQRLAIRRTLEERERTVKLPWFSTLVASPKGQWVAFALTEYAISAANRRDDEERARLAQEEWLRRTAWLREWSDRQNRPQALARAVSGAFAVGVVLFGLVGISDMVGVATDADILDGWFAVVAATAAILTFESLLAWEVGGRFHPRYSLLGAGMIAIGRVARTITAQGIALAVVAGVLVGLGAFTVYLPAAPPFLLAVLVIVWTIRRYRVWRADQVREREIEIGPGTPVPDEP